MGDMGDTFNAMKEESKKRRANNRDQSAQLLTDTGIHFVSKNGGAHLIVFAHVGKDIDFWPGTGLWIPRDDNFKGYGVKNLMKYILDRKTFKELWENKHIVVVDGEYIAYD